MKVQIISTSRADRGPLEAVRDALMSRAGIAVGSASLEIDPMGGAPEDCANAAFEISLRATDMLSEDPPDLVVLLGDRYETLGVAVASSIMRVPIAHLSGGDVTEGSADDCYRHAVSKLAHLHFPTHHAAAERLVQMGEAREIVHCVGCPGIDKLLAAKLPGRGEALEAAGLPGDAKEVLLVCMHPNSMGNTLHDMREVMLALSRLPNDLCMVIVGPNADANHDVVRECWKGWARDRPRAVYRDTLGQDIYLSLMKHCLAMVGNSSSGLYEAPSFGTVAINIGERQMGRPRALSVIDCPAEHNAIFSSIALVPYRRAAAVTNPYGDGHAGERIADVIAGIGDTRALLRKVFYDLRPGVGGDTQISRMGRLPAARAHAMAGAPLQALYLD